MWVNNNLGIEHKINQLCTHSLQLISKDRSNLVFATSSPKTDVL